MTGGLALHGINWVASHGGGILDFAMILAFACLCAAAAYGAVAAWRSKEGK